MDINHRTGHAAICGTKFERARASEHRNHSGLYDIQITTLDPKLINAVRNLKGQRVFIRLHRFDRCKPPLEHIGAEMQSHRTGYFTPNPIVSLLHKCFYSHFFLARRDNFYPFCSALARGPKVEEEHSIPSDRLSRTILNRSTRDTYNTRSTGELPERARSAN